MEGTDGIHYNVAHKLRSVILTPAVLEVILKSLPTRKLMVQMILAIKFFVNWQLNLHVLSVLLLIGLCKQALSLIPVSYQMCALSTKQVIVNLYQIIACLSFMHVRISLWTSYFQTCFTHFIDNSILNLLQPGFSPGDTTVNQLTYLYNTCTFSQPFFLKWGMGIFVT